MTEDDYRRLPDDRLLDCWWHANEMVRQLFWAEIYGAVDHEQSALWTAKQALIYRILKERGISP